MRPPDGFLSTDSRGSDGSIETEQRLRTARPVVPFTDEGARALGRSYWLEVTRSSLGLVRGHERRDGVELLLAGVGRPLLRLAPPRIVVSSERITCTYAISGGLLARSAGGTLTVSQIGRTQPELQIAVNGFFPRLGGPPARRWRGALYEHLQRRLHVAISRRYFERLLRDGAA
jgi:hypothetical protein